MPLGDIQTLLTSAAAVATAHPGPGDEHVAGATAGSVTVRTCPDPHMFEILSKQFALEHPADGRAGRVYVQDDGDTIRVYATLRRSMVE